MITIETLKQFCSIDPYRSYAIGSPFLIELNGEKWSIATDGRWLVGVRGQLEGVIDGHVKSMTWAAA